jgi:hypothetical protein
VPISGPAQRAARLLSTLGRPGSEELDAMLESVDEEAAIAASSYMSPMELATASFAVFVAAHEISQTCSRDQRAKLRGCSTRLVALALDQALLLYNGANLLQEKVRACQGAKRELASRIPSAAIQSAQAQTLLSKVATEEVAAKLGALDPACGAATKLEALAELARELVSSPLANVATRTRLYGIDSDFAAALEKLAGELRAQEILAEDVEQSSSSRASERARAATWVLAQHFVETFASARLLDKTIPNVPWTPRKAPAPPSEARPAMPVSGTRLAVRAAGAAPPTLRLPTVLAR